MATYSITGRVNELSDPVVESGRSPKYGESMVVQKLGRDLQVEFKSPSNTGYMRTAMLTNLIVKTFILNASAYDMRYDPPKWEE